MTRRRPGRIDAKAGAAFLALIVAQAAHSVEEHAFRLFDVLAPARFISSLFSNDLSRGFAVANALLVLAGVWCYLAIVRRGRPAARAVAWFWGLLELGNGVSHTGMAVSSGGYFPGVGTAPLLLAISSYLLSRLVAGTSESSGG